MEKIATLEAAIDPDAGIDIAEAMAELLEFLARAFAAAATVRIDDDHMAEALAIATAYTDAQDNHALLARTLSRIDDRASVDAGYRLGIYGALGQLVSDALVAAVFAYADDDIDPDQVSPDAVRAGCQQLLQRIAVARLRA